MVYYSAQLDNTFFALSSRIRRDILNRVRVEPVRLVDLAGYLGLSFPALGKHVDVLERAKLIEKEKIGRERFIMANLTNISTAEEWITEYTKFWNLQFASLESYIDSVEEKQ